MAGIAGLDAANIDPEAAAREYRERAVGPYRGLLPDSALASMEESLSGACTVEIAAFDTFAALLGDPEATAGYDHVIFDTAPTGHTLRLLALPAAWSGFIDTNTPGSPAWARWRDCRISASSTPPASSALGDPQLTTLVLVSRPERTALAEAERTRAELAGAGMRHQVLALNGVFDAIDSDDDTAVALAAAPERRAGGTARRTRRAAARRGSAAGLRADRPRRARPGARPRPPVPPLASRLPTRSCPGRRCPS